jgi:hypothetical protein
VDFVCLHNWLHALSKLIDFSPIPFDKQCSDKVTTAVEEFTSTGIAFKLGGHVFFAEPE